MPHEEIEVYDGSENEFYNIQSPGVKFIFDTKVGNFPIALKTREGKLLYNKFSDSALPLWRCSKAEYRNEGRPNECQKRFLLPAH